MIRSTLLLCILTAPLYAMQEQPDIHDGMPPEFTQQSLRMQLLKKTNGIKAISETLKSISPVYDTALRVMFNYAPSDQYLRDITHYLRTAPITHSDDGKLFEDEFPCVLVAPLIFTTHRCHAVIALITEDPLLKQLSPEDRTDYSASLERLRADAEYGDQPVHTIALTEIKKAQNYASLIASKVQKLIKEQQDDTHNAFTWACTQLSHVYGSDGDDSEGDNEADDEGAYKEHIHFNGSQASPTMAHYVPFTGHTTQADTGASNASLDLPTDWQDDEQRTAYTDMHNTIVDLKNQLAHETHTGLLLQVLQECTRVQEVTTHAHTLLEKEIAQRAARPAERRKTIIKFAGMLAGAFLAPVIQSYFEQEDGSAITDCSCPHNAPSVVLSAGHLLSTSQDASDREQLPHTTAVIEQLKAMRLKLP